MRRGQRFACGIRWLRPQAATYWNEQWRDRTELLGAITESLSEQQWPLRMDPGWDIWDLEIFCGPWTVLRLFSTQEDHSHGKRLCRIRYELRSSAYARALVGMALVAVVMAASLHTVTAVFIACMALLLWVLSRWRGSALASRAVEVVAAAASALGWVGLAENDNNTAA
jgi:hypothetical protein